MRKLLNIYTFLLLLFLYLPISVLVVFSFNKSKISSVWKGFSMHWYEHLIGNGQMLESLKLSLTIAIISSIIATALGTLAAYALHKIKSKRKRWFQIIFDLPIVTPDLVLGIGLLIFYRTIHFQTGLVSVIIGHITFNIPFAILILNTRFKFIDSNLENAAIDLGASQIKAFYKVTIPMIKPGILAAVLICFHSLLG